MTGPEHLREGKRLLDACRAAPKGSPERASIAAEAQAHLAAAQVIAYAAAALPDRISWQEAGDA